MFADLKFALRQLRKSPGFTITAVLTLALGIGANTAIFTLVDSILLRSLPYTSQDRLMRIGYGTGDFLSAPVPKGWIVALGGHDSAFASVSGYGPDAESNVGNASSTDRVFGAEVMGNAFDTLELHPAMGRFFAREDTASGSEPVTVLSYGYWLNRFAGNPDVIGTTLKIDGVSRRVIGIMPAGVHFPYADTRFVTPVTFRGGDPIDPWNNFDLRAFGRLRPGVTAAQAQAELRHLQKLLLPQFPWTMPKDWPENMTVVPLLEAEVGPMRPRLLLLFGAVGLVLLIACANIANLMLARAAGREREMAIRGALGASAQRLVRQLLVESVVLGGVAGAVGLAAGAAGLRALVRFLPADTPRLAEVGLHWPVILFASGVSILTGILFGLIPALQMSSTDLRQSLLAGSRSITGKAGQFRVSMLLVIGQIALSVVVITSAGLVLRSLWSLAQVNPGFRSDRIVTAEVAMDADTCANHQLNRTAPAGRCQAFFETLLDHLHGVAGEENVALTSSLPLSGQYGSYAYDVEGRPRDPGQEPLLATQRTVSPEYFQTLGMHVVEGRALEHQDEAGTSRAAIISQHMATQLWPGKNPLGQHLLNVVDEPEPAQWVPGAASLVAGVVSNTHDGSLASAFGDEVYFSITPMNERPVMYVLLRTRSSTEEAAAELRRVVTGLNPQVSVTRVQTLNEVVADSESTTRSLSILLLSFGVLAVVIGGVGVYSLVAYIVNWRTREFGIRLALGAQRWQIVRGLIRQSILLAGAGCVAGLAAAGGIAQLLRGFLFGIQAIDPVTFCAVPVLMTVLAILATWLPARRAASVDPMTTLRLE